MNYSEALSYMEEKNKLGSVPGLTSITELLNRLGNPEVSAPVFHIAGTNGKGSVMAYIESILIEAGYMVGRYISPTIFDYRERFQINKQYISEEDCSAVITEVAEKVSEMTDAGMDSPTAFEIETAAAFLYFKKQSVDIMLVECGMGGRLDATNVFPKTMVNILASVSRDHMNFLGDSISKITEEKLGIVKPGEILVTYPLVEEAENAVATYCRKNQVRRYRTAEEEIIVEETGLHQSRFIYKGESYEILIPGDYQMKNAATAIEAILAFNDVASEYELHSVAESEIRTGLLKTNWPGRFTLIGTKPYFIVDGAHNRDAWKLLAGNLNKYFTKQDIIYIIGVLRDKEYDCMLDFLTPNMKYSVTVTPDSPRALDGRTLAELISARGKSACYAETLSQAVMMAEEKAGKNGIVVACGSLTFIGDIIKIKAKEGCGPDDE